ncbi:cysteine hydrolase family protein [Parafrankia discariae]|uniref:hypothetical protein n=1 Tax=Parafrankia discariae TaxID=365528 RepID=UPI0003605E53|nr:hypothetical protein [Parafrankia discariae]
MDLAPRTTPTSTLSLDQAAFRAHTKPRILIAWIADGLLPATWTTHGWQIHPNALARTVSKIWNWAA